MSSDPAPSTPPLSPRPPGRQVPPPWKGPRDHPQRAEWQSWHQKRRFLLWRFLGLVLFVVLILGPFSGGLAFAFARLVGGPHRPGLAGLAWLLGCSLVFLIPLAIGLASMRFFRGAADPLARVMAAADQVAEGDLSVRVPESGPEEIRRLASSFNHMVGELERADQQRRNLTADVAHELRTPIHILQGNLEGILEGVYQATPEQINLMLEETNHLRRLVEDLRTLSLAEAGQLVMERGQVDIAGLVQDAATSFSGQADAAGISLRVELEKSPLTIQGDAGRLDQVLGNLLANALRHTPAGGTITLRAGSTAGGARLQVTDTGTGIPAGDLPFIFDRFWKGDRARSRGEGGAGSGLGLAIARQLVQAHGGKITAESQPGQGTTFTIDLPGGETDDV